MNSPLPLNPALATLPVYQPGRPIEEVARELGRPAADLIKLASNENPFGPSPLALTAMEKALRQTNLYPDGNAFYLKGALAKKLGVQTTNLVVGNGSNEIIEFVRDKRNGWTRDMLIRFLGRFVNKAPEVKATLESVTSDPDVGKQAKKEIEKAGRRASATR